MVNAIRKMSLRTRLALLAGFAIVSLLVALFVAWRLARATDTFVLRQADSAVHAAARDLARELQANPTGYSTIEQATPAPRDQRRPGPAAPPHVEKLFAAYSDPLVRLSAITLHRYQDVEGGFCREDGKVVGYAVAKDDVAILSTNLTATITDLTSEVVRTGVPASRTFQLGNARLILVGYPVQVDGIAMAWAVQRIPYLSNVSDWPNLAALAALALCIFVVSGLALITVRDLRVGVNNIETGLASLTTDLNQQVAAPDTTELARISAAINELAATLRANIARQNELERDLRQGERLTALGRVVAGVAHEVRNPLSAIKLKVQLAQRSSYDTDKLDETFGVIQAEIDRLDKLVRRLLDLGGQQRLERSAVNLAELVRNRVGFFSDLAHKQAVEIDLSPCQTPIVIQGDGNRLSQVVDNIIQNSLEAMPDGGRLTVSCRVYNRAGVTWARLEFSDTGHGIKKDDQEHIFEPFHTGRATGTGLGLAIARSIVEEHGGRLSFDSQESNGTSFVIELPTTSNEVELVEQKDKQ